MMYEHNTVLHFICNLSFWGDISFCRNTEAITLNRTERLNANVMRSAKIRLPFQEMASLKHSFKMLTSIVVQMAQQAIIVKFYVLQAGSGVTHAFSTESDSFWSRIFFASQMSLEINLKYFKPHFIKCDCRLYKIFIFDKMHKQLNMDKPITQRCSEEWLKESVVPV